MCDVLVCGDSLMTNPKSKVFSKHTNDERLCVGTGHKVNDSLALRRHESITNRLNALV